MNFLAHIYLSNDDPQIMVGNFIGDFVKGRNFPDNFHAGVARGIELHRAIDEFTDRHPVVQQSKIKLRPKYRHYAGVIVDIFYDHFLSKYWTAYHATPLPQFADQVYGIMQEYHSILPAAVKNMLPYMMRDNWLVNYGNLQGIGQALKGISRRTRYDSKMNESIFELEQFYEEFKNEFETFMPDLKLHADTFLKQN
ncbi:ACP phosphodiesterase [Chryseolinea sp. H1M3-3]|uniref:acyl carrier protein phosphodiesterase n=1 Tax=Chryseolinea sp. H1M3-3 TaxID=3034144 RepID=UPI0023EB0F9E|nr:ACP phosphodiesterase [Chryseolinea sp. H1M3-3]